MLPGLLGGTDIPAPNLILASQLSQPKLLLAPYHPFPGTCCCQSSTSVNGISPYLVVQAGKLGFTLKTILIPSFHSREQPSASKTQVLIHPLLSIYFSPYSTQTLHLLFGLYGSLLIALYSPSHVSVLHPAPERHLYNVNLIILLFCLKPSKSDYCPNKVQIPFYGLFLLLSLSLFPDLPWAMLVPSSF